MEIPESNESFGKLQEYIDLAKNKYNIEIIFRPEIKWPIKNMNSIKKISFVERYEKLSVKFQFEERLDYSKENVLDLIKKNRLYS